MQDKVKPSVLLLEQLQRELGVDSVNKLLGFIERERFRRIIKVSVEDLNTARAFSDSGYKGTAAERGAFSRVALKWVRENEGTRKNFLGYLQSLNGEVPVAEEERLTNDAKAQGICEFCGKGPYQVLGMHQSRHHRKQWLLKTGGAKHGRPHRKEVTK